MKKLVFGLIATLVLSFNAHSQKVGENRDGKFVVTENLSFLKEAWNKLLKDNGITGEIDRFEITSDSYKDENCENDVVYYQITGYTRDNFGKVAAELNYSTEQLSFSLESSFSTCTCSGCTYGCHPRKLRGKAWCCADSCGSECSKTETATGK